MLKLNCARRKSCQNAFGQGFDSPRLHQNKSPPYGAGFYFATKKRGVEQLKCDMPVAYRADSAHVVGNLYFRSTGTKMQIDEPEPCATFASPPLWVSVSFCNEKEQSRTADR